MDDRLRRVLIFSLVIALAVFMRVKAALELPVDFDEPVYTRAGMHYAQALQNGDLDAIVRYDFNLEHPVLVKLLYGAGIALRGSDVEPEQAIDISRMISVGFGVALVALMALVEPFAGLMLALHTMNTKYTSQAYLEALPAFASALAVLAVARCGGRRNRWFWLAAVALGVTAAGKYIYLVAGLVVVGRLIWDVKGGTLRRRDLLLFGLVSLAVFVALNPILWADPLDRFIDSVTFHGTYTESAEVDRYGYAWWKPLDYMSHSFPVQWHGNVFLFPLDELIFGVGLVGLAWLLWSTPLGDYLRFGWAQWRGRPEPTLVDRESSFVYRLSNLTLVWFFAGLVFLLLWPTKWPQYTLLTATPLCLAAGLVVGAAWRWLRHDRAYWGKLSIDLLPRELWVAVTVLVLLTVGLGIWRSVVRHRQLRGWTTFRRETSALPSNVVQDVALDAAGRVWLGTLRGVTVLELPPQGQASQPQWMIYNQDNSGLPDNDVLAIAVGGEGRVWIGTRSGLTRFDPAADDWKTWTPRNAPLPESELRDIALASDGSVWVATTAGAVALTPSEEWRTYNTSNSELLSDAVFDIAVQATAQGDRIWFATNRGAFVLDPDRNTWANYTPENSGLAWDAVSGIAIDADGKVWLATFGRGVSTLSSDGQWHSYTVRDSDIPWSLVTTVVTGCRCGDRPAWLWFGTEGPGAGLGQQLAAYEPPPREKPEQSGRWHAYGYKNSGLPDSTVSDIVVQCPTGALRGGDPTSCEGLRVWIATYTAGLALYEPPNP